MNLAKCGSSPVRDFGHFFQKTQKWGPNLKNNPILPIGVPKNYKGHLLPQNVLLFGPSAMIYQL